MEELERHLRNLCVDDTRLRLLEAQWEYDKRLVQQALQTVGSTFPHYSLHDASHSNTILVNVTRVLGERVSKLSATDTWLILEAAYWHDVGMIVSDSTLRSWWSSEDFRRHLADLQDSDDVLLAASAKLLKDRARLDSQDEAWPINVRQALIFVVADFARKTHQSRSAEAIRRPTGYRIESPRTLIPQRLFEWLARICLGHGQSQEEVAKLPHCENGIGRDMCHPRFVGFMLRLGDLLDLDNGRFCPVLLASIGRIPPTSADHVGKHASITRFYISSERIDVEATCSDGQGQNQGVENKAHRAYQAISQWLEWLRSELTYLAVGWANIAPSGLGGGPPSIGTIRAQLSGYELVPNCSTSDFSVDSDYFLALSKSSGLFGQPQQAWQRELITNAVDATLIRLWHTATDAVRSRISSSDDPLKTVRELSEQLPVEITVSPCNEVFGTPPKRRWKISILDHGCGIGLDDLRSLQVIGSSGRNRQRRRLITKMPPELQPTGSFGLGFQSVFLDTDQVEIETHHLATRQSRRITIARPSRESDAGLAQEDTRAGVYIQPTESGLNFEPGTTVSFWVTRPASFGLPDAQDPILPTPTEPDVHHWKRDLGAVCASLPVPVLLNGTTLPFHRAFEGFTYFDRTQSMRITFSSELGDKQNAPNTAQAYRGSMVTTSSDRLVGYAADLYALNATQVLQVNRTSFTTFGAEEFKRRLENAFPKALDRYLEHLRAHPASNRELIQRASLVARVRYKSRFAGSEWESLPLLSRPVSEKMPAVFPISELLQQEDVELWVVNPRAFNWERRVAPRPRTFNIEKTYLLHPELAELIGERFKQICWVDTIGPINVGYFNSFCNVFTARTSGSDTERVERPAFEFSLLAYVPGRPTIPCPKAYEGLRLAGDAFLGWARIPAMLSPFTFKGEVFAPSVTATIEHPERYVEHVAKKRAVDSVDEQAAKGEVARLAWSLIQQANDVYKTIPWIKCEYNLETVRRVLEEIQRAGHT